MKKTFLIFTTAILFFANQIFANEKIATNENLSKNLVENFNQKKSLEINSPFALNPLLDFSLLSAGTALNVSTLFISDFNSVQFDSTKIFDKNSVNDFDKIFMKNYSKKIDLLGTVFEALTILTPLALIPAGNATGAGGAEWFTIGTMYAETMLFANGFKELAKSLVSRPRPYMYFDDFPQKKVDEGDWDASFFSGHSTIVFAAATFTSYTFCKYFPESNWKIPVIAISYSLATATAALRIASGNHFMTDVLLGAAVGSATGFLIPFLHSIGLNNNDVGKNKKVAANIIPNGFSFKVALN